MTIQEIATSELSKKHVQDILEDKCLDKFRTIGNVTRLTKEDIVSTLQQNLRYIEFEAAINAKFEAVKKQNLGLSKTEFDTLIEFSNDYNSLAFQRIYNKMYSNSFLWLQNWLQQKFYNVDSQDIEEVVADVFIDLNTMLTETKANPNNSRVQYGYLNAFLYQRGTWKINDILRRNSILTDGLAVAELVVIPIAPCNDEDPLKERLIGKIREKMLASSSKRTGDDPNEYYEIYLENKIDRKTEKKIGKERGFSRDRVQGIIAFVKDVIANI